MVCEIYNYVDSYKNKKWQKYAAATAAAYAKEIWLLILITKVTKTPIEGTLYIC